MSDKVDARRHHQCHSHANFDPAVLKLGRDRIGSLLQFSKRHFSVIQVLAGRHFEFCRASMVRAGHGNLVGQSPGGFG